MNAAMFLHGIRSSGWEPFQIWTLQHVGQQDLELAGESNNAIAQA